MSVFKKLVGFLFEEEEEIEDEGELEEITFHEQPKQRRQAHVEEAADLKHAALQEKPRVESVNVKASQPEVKQEPVKEKKFTSIEISEEQPKKVAQRAERNAYSKRSGKRTELPKQEYAFTPVISPIFGVDETSEGKHAKQAQERVPQLRTTISTAPKKNPLGTVLSPMYGATELEEFEEEAKLRLETDQDSLYEPEEETPEVIAYDSENEADEIVRVPLEELLSNEENGEMSEDLLQFSLFGNDEVVSTEKSEASYTIKE